MSSQHNHHDTSLIRNIIIRNTTHQLTIQKVRAHTKIFGNDEDNKLAKCGIQEGHILVTPFDLIGHIKSLWPTKAPICTHHDDSTHNLVCNFKKGAP